MSSDHRVARFGGTPSTPHLTDDQLLETYVLAGDSEHLPGCRFCKSRYDELVRDLESVRHDALADADSAFTPERLHDQRERIMRRIDRHDHPGEVVAFPHRPAHQPVSVHRMLGPARRWVAGAAAAGLAAGMFLGFAMDSRIHLTSIDPVSHVLPRPEPVQQSADLAEQYLLEVDEALIGSRVREMRTDLSAIDTMTTPVEIREVSYVQE